MVKQVEISQLGFMGSKGGRGVELFPGARPSLSASSQSSPAAFTRFKAYLRSP